MKLTRAFSLHAGLALIAVAIIGVSGCSDVTDPDNTPAGVITLSLEFEAAAPDASALTAPPPPIDSAAVSIFRPGGALEKRQGATANGASGASLTITCVAEKNKTVSVDLYANGVMWYHGAARNVNVSPNASTNVNVDAYEFNVGAMNIAPSVVINGEALNISWNHAPGASFYTLQESTTPEFDTVVWAAVMPDTATTLIRGTGAHYFRVAPATQFSTGTFTSPEGAYVLGGSQVTSITGLNVSEVIPGETFTIYGENLDFPGAEVWLGSVQAEVVSATWSELQVKVPLQAQTAYVYVYSPLDGGATYWAFPIQVQRIAFVSLTGTLFSHYKEYIEYYPNVIDYSSVVFVPVTELDWRDMSVFDLIVIAHDTGTSAQDWGGSVPQRADAIANSGADVLAIGLGGAVYLAANTQTASGFAISGQWPETLHVPDGSQSVFSQPTQIILTPGNELLFSGQGPVSVVAFDILPAQKPTPMRLLAESARGSNRWTLLDFSLVQQTRTVRHFFWGLAEDPYTLTGQGAETFSNIINELYTDGAVVIPLSSRPR